MKRLKIAHQLEQSKILIGREFSKAFLLYEKAIKKSPVSTGRVESANTNLVHLMPAGALQKSLFVSFSLGEKKGPPSVSLFRPLHD